MVANSRLRKHRHPRFEWLVNRGPQQGTLVYYVFDLLSLDGKDLHELPLLTRKVRLQRLLKNHERLIYVDHIEARGARNVRWCVGVGTGRRGCQECSEPLRPRSPTKLALAEDTKSRDYKRHGKVDGNLVGGKAVGRTVLLTATAS